MGKILGISDLPVSTIMSPFEAMNTKEVPYSYLPRTDKACSDVFITRNLPAKKDLGYIKRCLNRLIRR